MGGTTTKGKKGKKRKRETGTGKRTTGCIFGPPGNRKAWLVHTQYPCPLFLLLLSVLGNLTYRTQASKQAPLVSPKHRTYCTEYRYRFDRPCLVVTCLVEYFHVLLCLLAWIVVSKSDAVDLLGSPVPHRRVPAHPDGKKHKKVDSAHPFGPRSYATSLHVNKGNEARINYHYYLHESMVQYILSTCPIYALDILKHHVCLWQFSPLVMSTTQECRTSAWGIAGVKDSALVLR